MSIAYQRVLIVGLVLVLGNACNATPSRQLAPNESAILVEEPPEGGGAVACVSDGDCGDGAFCDRGLACVKLTGGATRGNDCVEGESSLRAKPCGDLYLCLDGRCRSCVNDSECGSDRACVPLDGYGNQCVRNGDQGSVTLPSPTSNPPTETE